MDAGDGSDGRGGDPVMGEVLEVVRAAGNYGVAGLIVWLLYRLADKWAPQFLKAHQDQAAAMTDMAKAVREGREEQRDLVIAVRVLAAKIDQMDAHVRGERAAAAGA